MGEQNLRKLWERCNCAAHAPAFPLNRADVSQQRLEANGAVRPGSGRNALLVYSAVAIPVGLSRSPKRSLAITSVAQMAEEVWLQELPRGSSTTAELADIL
jgi:hypothetical protein